MTSLEYLLVFYMELEGLQPGLNGKALFVVSLCFS